MPTRRQTTIGLLSAAVGSAAVTSGSFLSETASAADLRVVVVSELSLTPARPNAEYVTTDEDGEVESIEIQHLNQRASTWFEGLIEIANNGDVTCDELAFEFTATDGDESSVEVAETLQVISGDEPTETDSEGRTTLLADGDKSLGPGDAVTFGVLVNLNASSSPGNRNDLPNASDVALEITAIRE